MSKPVEVDNTISKRTIDELSLSTSGSDDKKRNKSYGPNFNTAGDMDEEDGHYIDTYPHPPYNYRGYQTSTPTGGPPPHPYGFPPHPVHIAAPPLGRTCTDADVIAISTSLKGMIIKDLSALIHNEIHPVVLELSKLKIEVASLREENSTLKLKLDDLEQYGRRPLVRFSGIPETTGDTNEDTTTLILNACTDAGITISVNDIERSHRVGKRQTGKPRQIIARTNSSNIKFYLLKESSKFHKSVNHKHVSVNEDLTKLRDELLYHCRMLARSNNIQKAWTTNGKVKIKDNNEKIHIIHEEKELEPFGHVIKPKVPKEGSSRPTK